MTRSTRLVQRALLMTAACVALPATALAHAIHTTLTVVRAEPTGFTITVRSFVDDFSASVARQAGYPMPKDSSVRGDDVTNYVRARFQVSDASGRRIVLAPCGIRREGEVYFACFRAVVASGLSGIRLRNGMLTELHADQVNIVQVEQRGARRTLLFTGASAPALLQASS